MSTKVYNLLKRCELKNVPSLSEYNKTESDITDGMMDVFTEENFHEKVELFGLNLSIENDVFLFYVNNNSTHIFTKFVSNFIMVSQIKSLETSDYSKVPDTPYYIFVICVKDYNNVTKQVIYDSIYPDFKKEEIVYLTSKINHFILLVRYENKWSLCLVDFQNSIVKLASFEGSADQSLEISDKIDLMEEVVNRTLNVHQNLEYRETYIEEKQESTQDKIDVDNGSKCLYLAFELSQNVKEIEQIVVSHSDIRDFKQKMIFYVKNMQELAIRYPSRNKEKIRMKKEDLQSMLDNHREELESSLRKGTLNTSKGQNSQRKHKYSSNHISKKQSNMFSQKDSNFMNPTANRDSAVKTDSENYTAHLMNNKQSNPFNQRNSSKFTQNTNKVDSILRDFNNKGSLSAPKGANLSVKGDFDRNTSGLINKRSFASESEEESRNPTPKNIPKKSNFAQLQKRTSNESNEEDSNLYRKRQSDSYNINNPSGRNINPGYEKGSNNQLKINKPKISDDKISVSHYSNYSFNSEYPSEKELQKNYQIKKPVGAYFLEQQKSHENVSNSLENIVKTNDLRQVSQKVAGDFSPEYRPSIDRVNQKIEILYGNSRIHENPDNHRSNRQTKNDENFRENIPKLHTQNIQQNVFNSQNQKRQFQPNQDFNNEGQMLQTKSETISDSYKKQNKDFNKKMNPNIMYPNQFMDPRLSGMYNNQYPMMQNQNNNNPYYMMHNPNNSLPNLHQSKYNNQHRISKKNYQKNTQIPDNLEMDYNQLASLNVENLINNKNLNSEKDNVVAVTDLYANMLKTYKTMINQHLGQLGKKPMNIKFDDPSGLIANSSNNKMNSTANSKKSLQNAGRLSQNSLNQPREIFNNNTQLKGKTVQAKLENYFDRVKGEYEIENVEFISNNKNYDLRNNIGQVGNPSENDHEIFVGYNNFPGGNKSVNPLVVNGKNFVIRNKTIKNNEDGSKKTDEGKFKPKPLGQIIRSRVGKTGDEVNEKRIDAICDAAETISYRIGLDVAHPTNLKKKKKYNMEIIKDENDEEQGIMEQVWEEDDVEFKEKVLKLAKDNELKAEINKYNNKIVKNFNVRVTKKTKKIEEFKDQVKHSKMPPAQPNAFIFRDEENQFPIDYNMAMYNYVKDNKKVEAKSVSDNQNRSIVNPLKQCQNLLGTTRQDIALKKKELKLLNREMEQAIKDRDEMSEASYESDDSDKSREEKEAVLRIRRSEDLIEKCQEEIKNLKGKCEQIKEQIKMLKHQLVELIKGWAHWDQNAPDSIFEFKLNSCLREITDQIQEKLAFKAKKQNTKILETKEQDENDFNKKIQQINDDYN